MKFEVGDRIVFAIESDAPHGVGGTVVGFAKVGIDEMLVIELDEKHQTTFQFSNSAVKTHIRCMLVHPSNAFFPENVQA